MSPSSTSGLSSGVRGRLMPVVAWGAVGAALVATFSWYLQPEWVVDIGAFMAWCGLR